MAEKDPIHPKTPKSSCELSDQQLEQVAGGAVPAYLKIEDRPTNGDIKDGTNNTFMVGERDSN